MRSLASLSISDWLEQLLVSFLFHTMMNMYLLGLQLLSCSLIMIHFYVLNIRWKDKTFHQEIPCCCFFVNDQLYFLRCIPSRKLFWTTIFPQMFTVTWGMCSAMSAAKEKKEFYINIKKLTLAVNEMNEFLIVILMGFYVIKFRAVIYFYWHNT